MIEDANQAFNAYKAGELDQVSIPSALVPSTKADPQLNKELITIDRLSTFRVSLVNTKAPLDNKKVRQALAYAIDRKALVDVALKGVGKPATSFIPPGLAGYDEKAEPGFNAQKAKQLLAEAGFPDGKGLPKIVFTYTNAANNPPLATNMKEQWKNNLNVDVELEPVDSKTFSTRFKAGDVQFAFVGWGADYPDAENFLVNNFRTGTGNNKSFYSNKEFDALLAKAQVETDRTKAAEIYKQAQKLMQDDSPDIFLFYSQFNALRKPWVKGILNSSMDFQFLGDRFLELAKIVKH
jgi:oligopeptide transport system substrate-binding protein